MLQFTYAVPPDHLLVSDHTYSVPLVLLAYVVASTAGYTTLAMADRVKQKDSFALGELWRWIGALSLGCGIWAMHFIAMLAYISPLAVHYDVTTTLISLVVAVFASYLVMMMIGRQYLNLPRCVIASVVAGCGIATMHYTGMMAIHSEAEQYYDPLLFILSIIIAIVASLAALLLAHYFRGRRGRTAQLLRLFTALVMGGAIVSMHFTGMAAMTLAMPDMDHQHSHSLTGAVLNNTLLALTVGATSLTVIGLSLGAAWANQRLREQRDQIVLVSNAFSEITQYDQLTGLLNNTALVQQLEHILSEYASDKVIGVAFINLDRFKRVNDAFGRVAGDDLLVQAAQRIRAVLGPTDRLARYAGDEFCVISQCSQPEQLEQMANRLIKQLSPPFALPGHQLSLTITLGYSLYPLDGETASELLHHASLAINQARMTGSNRYQRYSHDLQLKLQEELTLEIDLRQALQDDLLSVHYQPIVSSRAGTTVCLEALVRWQHPQLGMINPMRFVNIAEQSGFIGQLDEWVLTRSCRDLKALHELGFTQLRASVNCSALNITNTQLPERVAHVLAKTQLAPETLTLEVTENALMINMSLAIDVLHTIRKSGVKVSIDDFGTGYSSLAYLGKLPVDTLKVDRSFIRDIPTSPTDMAIASAIIAMAHKLELKVVAEGVETLDQKTFLQDSGCDFFQGYLFSRPLTLADLVHWLESPQKH